jgi:hypothetical protein
MYRWDSNLSSSDPDVNPRPWLHRKMKNESFLISFASNGLPRLLLKMRIKKVFHPFPKSRPRFTSEPNVEMKELFSKKMSFYEIVTLNYILMQNLLQMCFRGHWLFFTAWNCKKRKETNCLAGSIISSQMVASTSVTIWVCEKIAQNVAQPVFLSKWKTEHFPWNKVSQN